MAEVQDSLGEIDLCASLIASLAGSSIRLAFGRGCSSASISATFSRVNALMDRCNLRRSDFFMVVLRRSTVC
jgi:hypothetical protein